MKKLLKQRLSQRQYELARMLSYEFKRWKCRIGAPKSFQTKHTQLHLGCGDRRLEGWLNVDLWGSDLNLDIAVGTLPFANEQFTAIAAQHVIEHLTLEDELLPLLKECFRTLKPDGEIWLSTPDLEKVTKSYLEKRNTDMVEDRQQRLAHWHLHGAPSQHFMNDIFHQQMEHRNLFDLELLTWALLQAGFNKVERVDEGMMLSRFVGFPARGDDYQSIYVKATK